MREYLAAYRELPYRGPLIIADGRPTEPPVLIAALRPRMLELAASATDGALPFFVTADRLAWMREVLDDAAPPDRPRPLLATALAVVVEPDPELARAFGRAWLPPYCRAVNYQHSLAEQGFDASDWEPPYSDRLMDALVAWGDADGVRARIAEYHAAGADHVAIIPLTADGAAEHLPTLEALAPGGRPDQRHVTPASPAAAPILASVSALQGTTIATVGTGVMAEFDDRGPAGRRWLRGRPGDRQRPPCRTPRTRSGEAGDRRHGVQYRRRSRPPR